MMTIIRRERHRPMWRHPGVLAAVGLTAVAGMLTGVAWHLGAPVAVRPMAMVLPDTEVTVSGTGE